MDWDEALEIESEVEQLIWLRKYGRTRGVELTTWVSTFHPEKLKCQIVHHRPEDDPRGSFNIGCKVRFTNNETWMVRFPRGGKIKLGDEKVAAEVATMRAVKTQCDVPVPEIKAWGLAADNVLGIGPFIMTSFVEGVSLGEILQNKDPSKSQRLMPDDISDASIEKLYRQVARIMLQLSKLNFARIGSLSMDSSESDGYAAAIRSRPVTMKAHDILQVGGIGVFCSPNTTFSSTSDYFEYVADQDLNHLHSQLNSVDDEQDARSKYVYWNVAKSLISRFTCPSTNHGPFKLICDDFGPANMIVNNADDLEIVAVIDWEWSYAGPEELLWSPPRWLVLEIPNVWSSQKTGNLTRYNKYFEIFAQMIEEQEGDVLGEELDPARRPSTLLRQRQQDGSAWFYHIIRESFNGPNLMPFAQLRAAVPDFDELANAIPKEEVEAFVQMKMTHLQHYRTLLTAKQEWLERVKKGGEERIPGIDYIPEVNEMRKEEAGGP